MFEGQFDEIRYYLPKNQKISIPSYITNIKEFKFYTGIPDFESFLPGKRYLLILDDLMNETDDELVSGFTR